MNTTPTLVRSFPDLGSKNAAAHCYRRRSYLSGQLVVPLAVVCKHSTTSSCIGLQKTYYDMDFLMLMRSHARTFSVALRIVLHIDPTLRR